MARVRAPTWALRSKVVSGSSAVQTQWGARESRSMASAALMSPSLTAQRKVRRPECDEHPSIFSEV
jgi:hypothetical protein